MGLCSWLLVLFTSLVPEARAEDGGAVANDWRTLAQARGDAGFYVARDALARRALMISPGQAERLDALKLLADTAARTGDWTVVEAISPNLDAPGPDCQCDDLAWHAARAFPRTADRQATARWLDAVRPDTPAGAEVRLWKAQRTLRTAAAGAADAAIPMLTELVRPPRGAGRAPPDVQRRAAILLGRTLCGHGRFNEGWAALNTPIAKGAPALDGLEARAWCAVDGGHLAKLGPLLPQLEAAAKPGLWMPGLPLLRAIAAGTDRDPSALRAGLLAARAEYLPPWKQAQAAAVDIARGGDPAVVLTDGGGLPHALVERLNASDAIQGLNSRLRELDREEHTTTDPTILAELRAERVQTGARTARVVSTLLEGYAGELGWLAEAAAARLYASSLPPRHLSPALLDAETRRSAAALRALLADPTNPPWLPERPGAAFRLALLELGAVPTASTITSLRTVLASPSFDRRDDATWTLAMQLLDAGRTDDARRELRRLTLAHGPHAWAATAALGDLAFARGDFASAALAYAAAENAPDPQVARYATYRRAWTWWAMNNPTEATRTLRRVIDDPTTPESIRRSARVEAARLATCRTPGSCAP